MLHNARLQALEHLQLKTVVKESHGSSIACISFNHTDPMPCSSSSSNDDSAPPHPMRFGNLFATVGSDQATVYDNSHLGRYVSVCVRFSNGQQQGDLSSCAWVNTNGVSCHPHGDAWLAVSGTPHYILVLSVVESRVIYRLDGHTQSVIALSGSSLPGLLLSLSQEGEIRLWDLRWGSPHYRTQEGEGEGEGEGSLTVENDLMKLMPKEPCFLNLSSPDALVAELHPSGRYFITGHGNGQLRLWILPIEAFASKEETQNWGAVEGAKCPSFLLESSANLLNGAVESIVFLPNERFAAKSSQGQVFIWCLHLDLEINQGQGQGFTMERCTMSPLVSIKGSASTGSLSSQGCRMSSTSDGQYLCIGNASGSVAIYDTRTGARAALVEGLRVGSPVCSCALSDDCQHLLAVMSGFIFRFEALKES